MSQLPPHAKKPIEPKSLEPRWSLAMLGALLLTVAVVMALATGMVDAQTPAENAATTGSAPATAQAAGAAVAGELVVEVELGDVYVKPDVIEVSAGEELTLEVTNQGRMPHDLKVDGGPATAMLDPGASDTLQLGQLQDSVTAFCGVPGHKEAGMTLAINVTGGDPAQTEEEATAEAEAAVIDFSAEPGDGWQPRDPALEPAPGGTEHEITLRAGETVAEVAPGVTQELWTFDGQVPGPTLRGKVGDTFTITLVNEGKVGHSIDFHASKVAWDDEMRTIAPGESLVYRFEAKHAGVFMYHCGTSPTLHHIGNGMYGAVVIDPPDLPPVDHEVLLVQSELYLGPQGQPGDLEKMQGEQLDAVVFNGFVNQYQHAPIRVEPGERVRAWVLDAGPSENSAFHVVGTVFDTLYKEGAYLLRPDASQGGAQALDLQPAQGGFVEFTFDEPGLYPIVTHKFANVGKGALGLFQAGETGASAGSH